MYFASFLHSFMNSSQITAKRYNEETELYWHFRK